MIAALIIGRGGSERLPYKNIMPVLGRPLMMYPLLAAKHSEYIDCIFLSTDSNEIKHIGESAGVEIIRRPAHLATSKASVEQVVDHDYHKIVAKCGAIEMLVLLFCNAATVTSALLDKGIEALREDLGLDSVVSVSLSNRYNPARAMRMNQKHLLEPYTRLPANSHGKDCYFIDGSFWITRLHCSELPKQERFPFGWIGSRVLPIIQVAGGDINYEHELCLTRYWLTKHGFSETSTPYE